MKRNLYEKNVYEVKSYKMNMKERGQTLEALPLKEARCSRLNFVRNIFLNLVSTEQ